MSRNKSLYYSALPGTRNSWTLLDIRRGVRRGGRSGTRQKHTEIIGLRLIIDDWWYFIMWFLLSFLSLFFYNHFGVCKSQLKSKSTIYHFSENGNFDYVNMSTLIEGSATNRTKSDSNILIYNRVPKCASTTMLTLLSRLKIGNNFTVESSNIYWKK